MDHDFPYIECECAAATMSGRAACTLAWIANAVGLLGPQLANEYLTTLSPEAIRGSAQHPGLLENPAAPLWKKYEELTRGLDREIELSMSFGGTEITVEARALPSGQPVTATVDFASTYLPEEVGD